jgi:hypothetical protein
MSLWLVLVLFGLIKLPLAVLLVWLPFRNDAAMEALDAPSGADEDGGSRTPPLGPAGPRAPWPAPGRPRGPHDGARTPRLAPAPRRRGPDCVPPPRAPRRVRTGLTRPGELAR